MTYNKFSFSELYHKYLKISIRFLIKKKLYTLINVVGMATAFAAVILISVFLIYEFGTDKHFSQYENLYRLNRGDNVGLPNPLKEYLETDFSEFEDICRFWQTYTSILRVGENNFSIDHGVYTDYSVFDFFDIEVLRGHKSDFESPRVIFLSESLCEIIFDTKNPIGEVVEFEGKYTLTVAGVFKNLPGNSHLRLDYLIPISTMPFMGENAKRQYEEYEQWGSVYYVLKQSAVKIQDIDIRLNKYIKEVVDNDNWEMHIQPFSDIYFNEAGVDDDMRHGNKNQLYVLLSVAIGILLLASINYFNLSTATSFSRSKEIAIKKTIGVRRITIVKQFFSETLLIVFSSVLFGLLLSEWIMPYFNNLYELDLKVSSLYTFKYVLWIVIFGIIICLAAGFYPAIILSGIRIQAIFSRRGSKGKDARIVRSVFIVLQYSISILLFVSVITINHQIKYMVKLDPGYDKDQLVYLSYGEEVAEEFDAYKAELLTHPSISGISQTGNVPGQIYWNNIIDLKGERLIFFDCIADADFAEVMGLEMLEGKFINPESPTGETLVINESAQKLLQLEEPIGYTGIWNIPIVGVIQDFHYQSMHSEIKPLMIRNNTDYWYATIKIENGMIEESLELILNEWGKHFPKHEIEYHFFDQEFKKLYKSEMQFGRTIFAFSLLAILISCIGLFGLTSYYSEAYKKTAGVKIVFGAQQSELLKSFIFLFLKWQLAGIVLGLIASGFVMHYWLQKFAYHTQIPMSGILISTSGILIFSFLTILYHSIKLSKQKPVDVLRDE